MTKRCQITYKKPMQGNNVSHSHRKTRRRFMPNLQKHRFWINKEKRYIKMHITTKGMRIIDKYGIEKVLIKT
ncbi:50S ribosomal protein L28 [Candidatus Portiera aleyrodidarum]|uniref:50S ribosomal protein L28 n=1 Tax=Candidatus Portiera aleyrodidarum TaxID=91844 RepID=UPI000C7923E9|nr:50S ribosomal protein L28 [Candidatus Portiera aleyrodidarum]AUI73006.1 50S ribosomal protein L28 [Candidatus Portiera aleyrodidarum]AUI73255.1 50S ribosomal protein L28 [Candidatus Portiera aleyrodidarum]